MSQSNSRNPRSISPLQTVFTWLADHLSPEYSVPFACLNPNNPLPPATTDDKSSRRQQGFLH